MPETPLFIDRGPCPLCGGGAFVLVHDFDQIPVRRCASLGCGFLHSGKVMSAEGTRRYYQETFGSEFHRVGQAINAAVNVLALRRLVPEVCAREADGATANGPAAEPTARVLDVGTGYGYLLRELRARGIEGVGVEVSTSESAYGRAHLGVDIRTGLLEEAGLPEHSFEVAMCFEVIEHVLEPVAFVRSLARHVKRGGWVIVHTDNFAAEAVRRMGARFPKWIPHTHVCHFEPATLRRCFALAGLSVERELSVTPWENAVRGVVGAARGWSRARAADVWRLEPHLAREMARGYPRAGLRAALAQAWFRARARADAGGSMMYMAARV